MTLEEFIEKYRDTPFYEDDIIDLCMSELKDHEIGKQAYKVWIEKEKFWQMLDNAGFEMG